MKGVGASKPYDLHLTRGDEKLHVEVKGTTSDGSQIILTRAEVEWQRRFAPDNALVIVHPSNWIAPLNLWSRPEESSPAPRRGPSRRRP